MIGLYALHRLSLVREEGEIENREMVQQVLMEARRTVRNLSTVAGLKHVAAFPSGLMIDLQRRRQEARHDRLRAKARARAMQRGLTAPRA